MAIPETVGGYRLIDTNRFADPAMGTAYRYRGNGPLVPDVYVYPLTEPASTAGGDAQAQARAESQSLQEALAHWQQQGRLEEFTIRAEGPFSARVGGADVPGWHVHALITQRGEPNESHQYVFVVGDRFVKVRGTYRPGAVNSNEMGAFVRALLRELLGPTAPTRG